MPNWCNNTITINADEKVLDSFENFLEANTIITRINTKTPPISASSDV